MTPIEVLKAARAKISQGWTQGNYAKDVEGKAIAPGSSQAVCWCIGGALRAVEVGWSERRAAANYLVDALGSFSIPQFNDKKGRTKEEVLKLFDKAIKLGEKE